MTGFLPQNVARMKLHRRLDAHDCGYPLSRYTCRATRVAADFLDFIAFRRCSTGVALHPLKILMSHLPPPYPGRCRTEIWLSGKASRYTGVSQLQLRVSRYTVQLSTDVWTTIHRCSEWRKAVTRWPILSTKYNKLSPANCTYRLFERNTLYVPPTTTGRELFLIGL